MLSSSTDGLYTVGQSIREIYPVGNVWNKYFDVFGIILIHVLVESEQIFCQYAKYGATNQKPANLT